MLQLTTLWDLSDTFVGFDNFGFTWDGNPSLDALIGHGSSGLDVYDNLNGSIRVAWPNFSLSVSPDSYNVYLNGVLNQNVATRIATITGLAGASYNGSVVTAPTTYRLYVTAVKTGVETAILGTARITVQPTSVMLVTPMKRILPFGSLPVN